MTRTAIARLGLVVVLVGCLAVVRPEAKREGDLLLASGFETRAADTPERITHLAVGRYLNPAHQLRRYLL